MAKLERTLHGDFDETLKRLHDGILQGSLSASYEDGTDWTVGTVRCSVRVYERYSWLGSNRVSMNITLLGEGDQLSLTAITAGGSQAMLVKINTKGEESFLKTLDNLL